MQRVNIYIDHIVTRVNQSNGFLLSPFDRDGSETSELANTILPVHDYVTRLEILKFLKANPTGARNLAGPRPEIAAEYFMVCIDGKPDLGKRESTVQRSHQKRHPTSVLHFLKKGLQALLLRGTVTDNVGVFPIGIHQIRSDGFHMSAKRRLSTTIDLKSGLCRPEGIKTNTCVGLADFTKGRRSQVARLWSGTVRIRNGCECISFLCICP